ncbi:MAG: glycosyl hydrolase [Verrucomicrobiota bacterium]|jgi:hypothetical protein
MKRTVLALLAIAAIAGCMLSPDGMKGADDMAQGFANPPSSARPWVYWFPLDGNITSNGITADLEAMKRVGIGGVLYMETDQGAPEGPARFAGPLWRDLFKHICSEARRLGLEVNMNNDAGWCGSGGPWITPELSMQRVVWTVTNVSGPLVFTGTLPQPEAKLNFYRDIALLAFPTPAISYLIPNIGDKSAEGSGEIPLHTVFAALPSEAVIPRDRIVDLTARLGEGGRLVWDVPAGRWTLLRLGHTTTGVENHPAPPGGLGLESDKLSKEASDAAFAGLMAKVIADSKSLAGKGKTLVSTHIDSWETGSQNWTPRFRREFKRLRGYDPLPFLPVMTGRVVDNLEVSERFLWDVRKTVDDLLLENYAGQFHKLANRRGLRLSIEAYFGEPAEDMAYAGRADEPMGEFWSWTRYGAASSCTEMASAAHIYGKPILGAEAFTATDGEKWQGYPGSIKELGDWAFCEGINRFVFHRYALQPWTNPDRLPGMSMGPWGLHYERTQTWWEQSKAWHEYLARCQFMLRQGLFAADLCFLEPEASPQGFHSPVKSGYDRPGYGFDGCTAEVVLTRMSVKAGRLVLPDGMSYRMLVLPKVGTMTPRLLGKIKELVAAGATVVGAPPVKSPSLSDYPKCDDEVKRLAGELWGTGEPPEQATGRPFGKGKIIWGGEFRLDPEPTPQPVSQLSSGKWIWRAEGNPAEAAPPGARYFRRLLTVEAASPISSARLEMTADNSFQCWVNGQSAGSGDDWNRIVSMDLTHLLKPGANLLAVAAVNGGDHPNPAGLIGLLSIKYADGRSQEIPTDQRWEAAESASRQWISDATASDGWAAAMELGPLGMSPWNYPAMSLGNPDSIPDIDSLCRLLAAMRVPADFSFQAADASPCLRFIHRVAGGTDLYFVANKYPRPEDALCSFRVYGRRPELWRPDTGRIERAAAYDEQDGCVRLPVRFDPNGSVFVVFRDGAPVEEDRITAMSCDGAPLLTTALAESAYVSATRGRSEAVELTRDQSGRVAAEVSRPGKYEMASADGRTRRFELAFVPQPIEITGPWDLRFPPNWGAPEHVTLDRLISWSDHPDAGVKYFSGAATYCKTIQVPASLIEGNRRFYLDLGEVAVIAQVKLNGQDLGILWKAPYRADVTGVLRPGDNDLEIKVVNLWINRLIGDEQLPEDSERNSNGTLKQWPEWLGKGQPSPTGRFTFTSWRLWHKNDRLVESGLLGPVTLQTSAIVTVAAQ